jgi:ubiquinone/menaquinone biosynthesis C-methylase UbiE
MINSEQQEITHDQFMLLVQGHAAFQMLWAGVQFKIFDTLNPHGLSRNELEEKLGLNDNPVKILIDGLLTLNLLKIDDENKKIKNSKIADKYLIEKSETSIIDALGWQNFIAYPAGIDFEESLSRDQNIGLRHFPGKGETLYQRLTFQPQLEKVFQDAMQSLSNAANYELIQNINFSKFKHILDFGGGNGTNTIKIVENNPHLKATIFDQPSICERALQHITSKNLTNKIEILPGDFFSTNLPEDIDCVLYSHIVTIWSAEKNIQLLKKIYNALPLQGQVFVFSTLSNDNGIGPITSALGSVYFQTVATGEGMIYSKKDTESFLLRAGFKIVDIINLPLDHTLIIGEK